MHLTSSVSVAFSLSVAVLVLLIAYAAINVFLPVVFATTHCYVAGCVCCSL